MTPRQIIKSSLRGERYFRWRGGDVSRIEALSDIVFALCLTLLVVSLEVPQSFDQLMDAFRQLPAFIASFAILIMCWFFHYQYHRRYGLEDGFTIFVNFALLLVILVYVYPLRFLFTVLIGDLTGWGGPDRTTISIDQWPKLMIVYSAGFAVIFLMFALLTWHAWRRRDRLDLDAVERRMTQLALRSHLISTGFGLASIGLVLVDPSLTPWAGMIYVLIGPVQFGHGYLAGRSVRKLAESS